MNSVISTKKDSFEFKGVKTGVWNRLDSIASWVPGVFEFWRAHGVQWRPFAAHVFGVKNLHLQNLRGRCGRFLTLVVQPSQGCVLDFASKGEIVHILLDIFVASKGDSLNLFYFCKGFLFKPRIISLQNQPSKLLSVKLPLDRVKNSSNNNKKKHPMTSMVFWFKDVTSWVSCEAFFFPSFFSCFFLLVYKSTLVWVKSVYLAMPQSHPVNLCRYFWHPAT